MSAAGTGYHVGRVSGWRRVWRWVNRVWWGLTILIGLNLAWVHWPVARVPLALGKQTTVITAPRNLDGTVNYMAALNAAASEGMTRENNAAIPIVEALGREFLPVAIRHEVLRRLGIDGLPNTGTYFTPLEQYVADRLSEFTSPGGGKPGSASEIVQDIFRQAETGLSPELRDRLAQWLELNERPLARMAEASRKTRYFLPAVCPVDPPLLLACPPANAVQFRAAGKAICLRAMLRIADGDLDGAWQDALLVHRLGSLFGQQPTLIGNLVGLNVMKMAYGLGCRIAGDPRLGVGQARAMVADLRHLPEPPSVSAAIDIGDRYMALDEVMSLHRLGHAQVGQAKIDTRVAGVHADFNVVLQEINRAYDRLVEQFRVTDPVERRKAVGAAEDAEHQILLDGIRPLNTWRGWLSLEMLPPHKRQHEVSRRVAGMLLAVMLPSVGRVEGIRCEAAMHRRLAELGFALSIWRIEKGRYPETLSPLAPDYISSVPNDYFTGEPLHYQVNERGYVLYSVGQNGRDDAGEESADGSGSADDIVVRVGGGAAESRPAAE